MFGQYASSPAGSNHYRFGFLPLTLSLISLQILPAYFDGAFSFNLHRAILVLILLSSLYLVSHNRRELLVGVALLILIMISNWSFGFQYESWRIYTNNLLHIAFFIYIGWYLLVYLFENSDVSADMIYAAICLYFLLGLVWNLIYYMVELAAPGSFSISAELSGQNQQTLLSKLGYYSYITLTTLGYGDITPVSRVARSWAALEAVVGQLYIAVVLARLVGLHISSGKIKD